MSSISNELESVTFVVEESSGSYNPLETIYAKGYSIGDVPHVLVDDTGGEYNMTIISLPKVPNEEEHEIFPGEKKREVY